MQHIIETVRNNFYKRLPENTSFYSLDDLANLGYPDFFIKRLELELSKNLADSLLPPDTEWANMESEEVQYSWQKFLSAIHNKIRLPRAFAKMVFESCLGDIFELLIRPRQFIPEIIFGNQPVLNRDAILQNTSYVTVYQYLPAALIKYMERKDIEEIDRKRAEHIIAMIDDKIISRYTPLNWAQLLEPWFELMGKEIDSELVRQFFLDKGHDKMCTLFDKESSLLDKNRFIELLSMPDLELFEIEDSDSDSDSELDKGTSEEIKNNTTSFILDMDGEDESASEEDADEDDTNTHSEDEITSKVKFNDSETDDDGVVEDEDDEKNVVAEWEPDDDIDDEDDEDDTVIIGSVRDEIVKGNLIDELEKLEKEDDEVPIWKRFEDEAVEEESISDVFAKDDKIENDYNEEDWQQVENEDEDDADDERMLKNEEESEDEEGFIEDPIIDLTGKSNEGEDLRMERLINSLGDLEDEFIEQIFGNDRNSYIEALSDLSAFNMWESASKYLKNEIFRRNAVEIYSETSIDFTDRLQTYFLEKKHEQ